MRDRDVRKSVWCLLEADHAGDPDTLMLDELGLSNGSVRVDIAVINGQFEGFELKSELDTLERLPQQRDIYSKVLDRVTLVVAEKHVKHANEIVPDWWGLCVASSSEKGVLLTKERCPKMNEEIDPRKLASLLWRDEGLKTLDTYNAAAGVRSKPREAIYQRLSEALDLDTLRAEVRLALKTRVGWRVDRRFRQYGDLPQS